MFSSPIIVLYTIIYHIHHTSDDLTYSMTLFMLYL